jgi:hypothetical protein
MKLEIDEEVIDGLVIATLNESINSIENETKRLKKIKNRLAAQERDLEDSLIYLDALKRTRYYYGGVKVPPMDEESLPVNDKINAAVAEYTDAIIKYITTIDPDIDYEVDYDETMDDTHTQKAAIVDIQSEYGFLTIFPDFRKNAARAGLLNRGLIGAMELEGFDDDTINSAPVYGALMPFSVENAEMFAIILTNDVGLQHQKNILE